jgi:hypothetical protein
MPIRITTTAEDSLRRLYDHCDPVLADRVDEWLDLIEANPDSKLAQQHVYKSVDGHIGYYIKVADDLWIVWAIAADGVPDVYHAGPIPKGAAWSWTFG